MELNPGNRIERIVVEILKYKPDTDIEFRITKKNWQNKEKGI